MRYRFRKVGGDLRYLALSQTPAYTTRQRIRASVLRGVPVYSPQLSLLGYSLHLPTQGW